MCVIFVAVFNPIKLGILLNESDQHYLRLGTFQYIMYKALVCRTLRQYWTDLNMFVREASSELANGAFNVDENEENAKRCACCTNATILTSQNCNVLSHRLRLCRSLFLQFHTTARHKPHDDQCSTLDRVERTPPNRIIYTSETRAWTEERKASARKKKSRLPRKPQIISKTLSHTNHITYTHSHNHTIELVAATTCVWSAVDSISNVRLACVDELMPRTLLRFTPIPNRTQLFLKNSLDTWQKHI